MKILSLSIVLLANTICISDAFLPYSKSVPLARYSLKYKTRNFSTSNDVNEEVAKLRAAAQKARDEAQKLSTEMGRSEKKVDESATTSARSSQGVITNIDPSLHAFTSKEIIEIIRATPMYDPTVDSIVLDPVIQERTLDSLCRSSISLWKSARPMTQRSFPVTLQSLSSRTSGLITPESLGFDKDGNIVSGQEVKLEDFQDSTIAVTLGSTLFAIASLALLPQNIGATACYLIAFIPIAWVAIGSTAPAILASIIGATRGGLNFANGKETDEEKFQRICAHEAGHFLCGYLSGLPIRSYTVGGETESGNTAEYKPFFDQNRRESISMYQDQAVTATPRVEFHLTSNMGNTASTKLNMEDIATISAVAMSGSVAEIISCGSSRGGVADLVELDNLFRTKSDEFIGAQKQQELTRWGALIAYQILTKNKEKYEKLVAAFRERKNVLECIAIIEGR